MQLLGVGLDLCWPPSPPMVGPAGLHELAQRVVALCNETEKTLDGLPAAAEDALIGRRWQDLAEREQALQRRCVELDERERQMELAFGQLDELRRHSLDLLAGLDRRSQAVVQREQSAVDMRMELDRLYAVHAALVVRAPTVVERERTSMCAEDLGSTRVELRLAHRVAMSLRAELRAIEAATELRYEKIADVVSRLAAEVPVSPRAGGGPGGPAAAPLTPCSPGEMQAGSGGAGMRAEPGAGGVRDGPVRRAGRGGAPDRTRS